MGRAPHLRGPLQGSDEDVRLDEGVGPHEMLAGEKRALASGCYRFTISQ